MPEDGYGWEKPFSERMGRHFAEDSGRLRSGTTVSKGGASPTSTTASKEHCD
jgi:hypothetical protein